MTPHDSPRDAFQDHHMVLHLLLGLRSLAESTGRLASHGVADDPSVQPAPSDPALLAVLGAISLAWQVGDAIDGLRVQPQPPQPTAGLEPSPLRELLR